MAKASRFIHPMNNCELLNSKKLLPVLILTFFSFQISFAQSYSVSGIVSERFSQSPLENIQISITDILDSNATMMTPSNNDGEYELHLTIVSIDELLKPREFGLGHNYPQPFNPSTTIPFFITEMGDYVLQAYDLLGREVASTKQSLTPASYSVRFQAASAGLYFISLSGDGFYDVIKVIAIDGSRESKFFPTLGHSIKQSSGILTKSIPWENRERRC
jgi:hypothetical protein